ncbi:MAG: hypothetical protein H7177_14725 [Rhizobacter sp.]|nr:hypothetical protein [Bacteriovorax sp.]
MKFLLAFFLFATSQAYTAEPIIIEIGGVRHQCTPIGNGNPAQCYNTAYSGPFSRDEALTLCQGAFNDSPAKCGIEAYRGRFSKSESILLCTGATTDTGPVDCANLAYSGPFSKDESLDLCSHNATERTATCAIDAYHGPYSKADAIKLCKNPRLAEEKMNDKRFTKDELNTLIEEANLKAFEKHEYK